MRVEFHNMAPGGDAVGRDQNGRAVFVPFAAPGESAEVEIESEHSSFARGRLQALQVLAPERIEAPCPVFGRCGGCQWQHLNYSAQLGIKRRFVVDALVRIGGLQREDVENFTRECVASPAEFGYRNKAELIVEHASASTCSGLKSGFYARGSHDLVDIESCPIQQNPNNRVLEVVRQNPHESDVLQRFTTRTASNGDTLVSAQTPKTEWPQARDWAQFVGENVAHCAGVVWRAREQKPQLLWGRDWLEETVDGLKLRVSEGGFFQINSGLTPTLLQTVRELARPQAVEKALDVFCGVGLFALDLARGGLQVLGIESGRQAIVDAKWNAPQNGLKARFVAGDAANELNRLAKGRERFDLVVLDPPRDGAKACLGAIKKLNPQRLVYVSCDPATLARDVQILGSHFRVTQAVPLDLFPQTAHVETVLHMERLG